MHIKVKNAHCAYEPVINKIIDFGIEENSRNGEVLVIPEPVIVTYENPCQRVVFHPERDANPFFHLMESIYFFAGRNDVEFLAQFVQNMRNFSDDDVIFNASYGDRIRNTFGHDQFKGVIDMLKKTPSTRRAVIQIWNPEDLYKESKDFACNLQMLFQIRDNKLNLTVTNRSNDALYGMLGANCVQFSMFQEYVASAVGVDVGVYNQITNNLHAYIDLPLWDKMEDRFEYGDDTSFLGHQNTWSPYAEGLSHYALCDHPESFLYECEHFCAHPHDLAIYRNTFIHNVAKPLYIAYLDFHKKGQTQFAIDHIKTYVPHCDWKVAAIEWLERRLK